MLIQGPAECLDYYLWQMTNNAQLCYVSWSPKTKSHIDTNFVVTSGITACHSSDRDDKAGTMTTLFQWCQNGASPGILSVLPTGPAFSFPVDHISLIICFAARLFVKIKVKVKVKYDYIYDKQVNFLFKR